MAVKILAPLKKVEKIIQDKVKLFNERRKNRLGNRRIYLLYGSLIAGRKKCENERTGCSSWYVLSLVMQLFAMKKN